VVLALVVAGILLIIGANKKPSQKENNFDSNDNIEIIVKDNPGGLQESSGNIQQNNGISDNLGAATIDDISGKQPNMGGQPTNTKEMLKDKEIEIQY